ncbi:dolichol-phosphate mannose synthase subunit 2-like [Phoenix dactylifera]|uniref:Dolichol phosphate-mannose biosynthesis regulatory protein n=1 Tax=Phoenix dactylifera TaxID=42345 RepID=A0A8B8JB37_PHODC|nr:dolichol-phosphate mannose synthase subunit 2-like [Phoenix dactylifera]
MDIMLYRMDIMLKDLYLDNTSLYYKKRVVMEDKGVGILISAISLSIFSYYIFWVIILPFVDEDHFIHKYFLPQEFAILIPLLGGAALLSFLCLFIGFVMLKSKYQTS